MEFQYNYFLLNIANNVNLNMKVIVLDIILTEKRPSVCILNSFVVSLHAKREKNDYQESRICHQQC